MPPDADEMERWQRDRAARQLSLHIKAATNIRKAQQSMKEAADAKGKAIAPNFGLRDFVQLTPGPRHHSTTEPDPIYRVGALSKRGNTATLEAANGNHFAAKTKRLRLFHA